MGGACEFVSFLLEISCKSNFHDFPKYVLEKKGNKLVRLESGHVE